MSIIEKIENALESGDNKLLVELLEKWDNGIDWLKAEKPFFFLSVFNSERTFGAEKLYHTCSGFVKRKNAQNLKSFRILFCAILTIDFCCQLTK